MKKTSLLLLVLLVSLLIVACERPKPTGGPVAIPTASSTSWPSPLATTSPTSTSPTATEASTATSITIPAATSTLTPTTTPTLRVGVPAATIAATRTLTTPLTILGLVEVEAGPFDQRYAVKWAGSPGEQLVEATSAYGCSEIPVALVLENATGFALPLAEGSLDLTTAGLGGSLRLYSLKERPSLGRPYAAPEKVESKLLELYLDEKRGSLNWAVSLAAGRRTGVPVVGKEITGTEGVEIRFSVMGSEWVGGEGFAYPCPDVATPWEQQNPGSVWVLSSHRGVLPTHTPTPTPTLIPTNTPTPTLTPRPPTEAEWRSTVDASEASALATHWAKKTRTPPLATSTPAPTASPTPPFPSRGKGRGGVSPTLVLGMLAVVLVIVAAAYFFVIRPRRGKPTS